MKRYTVYFRDINQRPITFQADSYDNEEDEPWLFFTKEGGEMVAEIRASDVLAVIAEEVIAEKET